MKIFKYLVLGLLFLGAGCEKSDHLFFDENERSLNIWLGQSGAPVDSVTYNFSHIVEGQDSVVFNYRLLGYPLDQDVDFELEALDGDIDLVYYSFGKYTIKAVEYQGQFPIYLNKPRDYNEFKAAPGRIRFRLKESNVLRKGADELSKLTLILRNGLSKPDNWDVAPLYYLRLSNYFGAYSDTKYSFIIQVTGRQNIHVYQALNAVTQENPDAISTGLATYYRDLCKIRLNEYKLQNNNQPLLDENQQEVVFP
jgi:hypothetical protein